MTRSNHSVLRYFLVFSLLLSACVVNAQQDAAPHRRAIRNIIEEKLRIDADSLGVFLTNPKEYRERHQGLQESESDKTLNSVQAIDNKKISTVNNHEAELHTAVNPTDPNNIVCSVISPSFPFSCPIYYSKDGGSTWKKSAFKTTQHGAKGTILGGGDPVMCFDHTGSLYLTWLLLYQSGSNANEQNMDLYWVKSTDGGVTFQRDETKDDILLGKVINKDYNDPLSVVVDKQWVMCDLSNSKYRGTFYAAMLHTKGPEWFIRLRKKDPTSDRFDTTSVTATIGDISYGHTCSLDVDTLGRVHMVSLTSLKSDTCDKGKWYWHITDAISADGGQSFESVHEISKAFVLDYDPSTDEFLGLPSGAASADSYPQVVCDKTSSATRKATNNMYCVWSGSGIDSMGTRGFDTYFSRSTDGGMTWSRGIVVNDDPSPSKSTQLFSTIAVNEDGIIAVCWYDRRTDSADNKGHYYMALSFDNGQTFRKNIQVTNQITDFSKFTGPFARSTGEYNQVVITKTHAIAFWADGRSGTMQVYMAKVPLDTAATGVETVRTLESDWSIEQIITNRDHSSFKLKAESNSDHTLQAQLYSLDGKLIFEKREIHLSQGTSIVELPFADLVNGAYLLRLSENDHVSVLRLLVQ